MLNFTVELVTFSIHWMISILNIIAGYVRIPHQGDELDGIISTVV